MQAIPSILQIKSGGGVEIFFISSNNIYSLFTYHFKEIYHVSPYCNTSVEFIHCIQHYCVISYRLLNNLPLSGFTQHIKP